MARRLSLLCRDKLCCSICLELVEDPVIAPCGHSYCAGCIGSRWDEEAQRGTYSCPRCSRTSTARPTLLKNTMVADLVEELRRTGVPPAAADPRSAGPGDVACDARKLEAFKSCLQSLLSHCELHLWPRHESPKSGGREHPQPDGELREKICSNHDEFMRVFCHQKCVCHREGHEAVSASAEGTDHGGQRVQRTGERVRVPQQDKEEESINSFADVTERSSAELVHLSKSGGSDTERQAESRQKIQISRGVNSQEKLQQEPGPSDTPTVNDECLKHFKEVTAAASGVRGKAEEVLSLGKLKPDLFTEPRGPKTRAEFLRRSRQLTLDPNTANARLLVSEENRRATVMTRGGPPQPGHPGRFADMFQVLSAESVSGRCYWEVEVGECEVAVAVAYGDISRAGYESGFGNDGKSWALECFGGGYEFRHDGKKILLGGPRSGRVGVYVDEEAGVLCFFSADAMTLLHRVQTTFTGPLYHGLAVFGSGGDGAAAELCKLD